MSGNGESSLNKRVASLGIRLTYLPTESAACNEKQGAPIFVPALARGLVTCLLWTRPAGIRHVTFGLRWMSLAQDPV
jgi:hypothetical protein